MGCTVTRQARQRSFNFCFDFVTIVKRRVGAVAAGAIVAIATLAMPIVPAFGSSLSECDATPSIHVTVNDIRTPSGQIVADLHGDDPDTFLKKGSKLSRTRIEVEGDHVSFCIPVAAPGRYAVAVYHDVNANRKFDKNLLGLPKEPYGVSNNPRVYLRAPKFDEAAIDVDGRTVDIAILLND